MIEDLFIEDVNGISEEAMLAIEHIMFKQPIIPFYWNEEYSSKKFPFYSHALALRPENNFFNDDDLTIENSEFFSFFYDIVKSFCLKNNVSFKNVIRANINSTIHIPGYEYTDPHVDFPQDHLVLLMYLNSQVGDSSTIIFDKVFDGEKLFYDLSDSEFDAKIIREVKPERGKIFCFNGKYFHANRITSPGENRFVCVFNLLI